MMMTRHDWMAGAMACLALTAANGFAQKAEHPDSKDWKPLFNKALDNAVFEKGIWYYDDNGDLTATEDKIIWTADDYENFVVDLEYRCGPKANSGVFIYCSDVKDSTPNSIEVQILDNNADVHPTWRNGGLFGHLAPKVDNVKPAGQWNRMTVTAKGKIIHVIVNGEVTVDNADISKWTDAKKNPDGSDIPPWLSKPMADLPTKGRIGFQGKHGGAPIFFRNMRVKQL
ncbi:MAG: DUF1080 domain-containing protein [Kiritimatiellaeota bacterium]|nr:DUF1080 domain-containing protein [Kiritimatiellota bacterium]